jgi:hypothetical protein
MSLWPGGWHLTGARCHRAGVEPPRVWWVFGLRGLMHVAADEMTPAAEGQSR